MPQKKRPSKRTAKDKRAGDQAVRQLLAALDGLPRPARRVLSRNIDGFKKQYPDLFDVMFKDVDSEYYREVVERGIEQWQDEKRGGLKSLVIVIGSLLAALPMDQLAADGVYSVDKDDFSNGMQHTLSFADGDKALLVAKCEDERKSFYVQVYIEETIYPDDVDFDRKLMSLEMTHKFDTAASAHSGTWLMSIGNYNVAQYPGEEWTFLAEALIANRLALKQNKTGQTYAFLINAADRDHLRTMQKACGLDGTRLPTGLPPSAPPPSFTELAALVPQWEQQYENAQNARATWNNCVILERVGPPPHTADDRGRVLNCAMGHGFPLK